MYSLIFSIFLCGLPLSFGSPSFNRLRVSRSSDTECLDKMCNWKADYPEEKIMKAVLGNSSYSAMFGSVLSQRQNGSTKIQIERKNMCPSTEKTYTPRTAENVEGTMRTIVNINGYSQLVTVQTCDKDAECFADSQSIKSGDHLFECKTQDVSIRLVVFKEDETLDVEHFNVPAGCYCAYKPGSSARSSTC